MGEKIAGENLGNECVSASLDAYENVFPIVVRTMKMIESLDQLSVKQKHLLDELQCHCLGIVLNIADGNNSCLKTERITLYKNAASHLSRTQSLLLLLNSLGILNKNVVFDLCAEYENCLGVLNSMLTDAEDSRICDFGRQNVC